MLFENGYDKEYFVKGLELVEALKKCPSKGTIVLASGSWYWIVENNEEKSKMEDFEFLMINDEGKPINIKISKIGDKWRVKEVDAESELGNMKEEKNEFERVNSEIISDIKAIKMILSKKKVKDLKSRNPHLRLTSINYSIFDEELERPAWRLEFKNWPLTSYVKSSENSASVKAIIDAIDKKIVHLKVEETELDSEDK